MRFLGDKFRTTDNISRLWSCIWNEFSSLFDNIPKVAQRLVACRRCSIVVNDKGAELMQDAINSPEAKEFRDFQVLIVDNECVDGSENSRGTANTRGFRLPRQSKNPQLAVVHILTARFANARVLALFNPGAFVVHAGSSNTGRVTETAIVHVALIRLWTCAKDMQAMFIPLTMVGHILSTFVTTFRRPIAAVSRLHSVTLKSRLRSPVRQIALAFVARPVFSIPYVLHTRRRVVRPLTGSALQAAPNLSPIGA